MSTATATATFPASINLPLVRVEKPRNLTYLGRRAVVTVEHHDKKRCGLRTITVEHIDEAAPENGGWPAGSVTRRTVEGDGQTANFRVVHAEALVA